MKFDEIYNTYFMDVYRYILRLSGNESVAEDVTSETFFKAWRSMGKFRGECDIRVWLCQITKNEYFRYLKKNKYITDIGEEEFATIPADAPSAESVLAEENEALIMRKYLHYLPEPYKEVFMWRVFAELGFSEIGGMFGKTDNWACVTFHRAKMMLKERIENAGKEQHDE